MRRQLGRAALLLGRPLAETDWTARAVQLPPPAATSTRSMHKGYTKAQGMARSTHNGCTTLAGGSLALLPTQCARARWLQAPQCHPHRHTPWSTKRRMLQLVGNLWQRVRLHNGSCDADAGLFHQVERSLHCKRSEQDDMRSSRRWQSVQLWVASITTPRSFDCARNHAHTLDRLMFILHSRPHAWLLSALSLHRHAKVFFTRHFSPVGCRHRTRPERLWHCVRRLDGTHLAWNDGKLLGERFFGGGSNVELGRRLRDRRWVFILQKWGTHLPQISCVPLPECGRQDESVWARISQRRFHSQLADPVLVLVLSPARYAQWEKGLPSGAPVGANGNYRVRPLCPYHVRNEAFGCVRVRCLCVRCPVPGVSAVACPSSRVSCPGVEIWGSI